MNSPKIPTPCAPRRATFRRWLRPSLVLFAVSVSAGATDAAKTAGTAPKTHALFMGADFSIEWQGKLRPVESVRGSSFVITVDGKEVVIPSTRTDLRVKLDKAVKVTAKSAAIDDLTADRAYSPERDPMHKLTAALALQGIADSNRDLAESRLRGEQMMQVTGAINPAAPRTSGPPLDDSAFGAKVDAVEGAASAIGSIMNSMPDAASAMGNELARGDCDAFRLSLRVSAPRPLADPYLIVVTRYQEDPERADTQRTWIYGQALPKVGEKPAPVHLYKGGFPPGYKLGDVEVHLYDRGQEIATNVSPKRVPLTLDEAMLYLTMEYCAAHKGEDLPASAALAELPAALRGLIFHADDGGPLWVKISADGRVTGVYNDQTGERPIDDGTIVGALQQLRYRPALRAGKPVESIARLKLSDFPTPL